MAVLVSAPLRPTPPPHCAGVGHTHSQPRSCGPSAQRRGRHPPILGAGSGSGGDRCCEAVLSACALWTLSTERPGWQGRSLRKFRLHGGDGGDMGCRAGGRCLVWAQGGWALAGNREAEVRRVGDKLA